MIKVEVIENFTLDDFEKLKNIVRATSRNQKGHLYVKDTFECDEEMVKYLTGGNSKKKVVIQVLEIIPKISEKVIEEKPKKKNSKKKKGE